MVRIVDSAGNPEASKRRGEGGPPGRRRTNVGSVAGHPCHRCSHGETPIYPGVCVDGRATPAPGCTAGPDVRTFTATETVEVRLALGGERDWDFDWVTFEALPDARSKADCREGGWATYGFRNQGLCIAFLNTGADSR